MNHESDIDNYFVFQTVLGRGIDCHLLGLREAASEFGVLDSLPFFSDPSFTKINYFKLSTSQVCMTLTDKKNHSGYCRIRKC